MVEKKQTLTTDLFIEKKEKRKISKVTAKLTVLWYDKNQHICKVMAWLPFLKSKIVLVVSFFNLVASDGLNYL